MNSPINTLFILQSLDWKINPWDSWDSEDLSPWREMTKIVWTREWIQQYYDLEMETDLHSLNSWRAMKSIWINREDFILNVYSEVSFIIIDSSHLNEIWVSNLAKWLKKLYLLTTNLNHPVFEVQKNFKNIEIFFYKDRVDFVDLMNKLKNVYKIENITIQSGWTLNYELLQNNLIDKISLVVAPVLIWWKDTPTLIDWKSIKNISELSKLKALKLTKVNQLKNSYLHLQYDVIKETKILDWFDVPN